MKKTLLLTAALIAMMSLGCNKSATGGGAGDQTFKLVVPTTSTSIKQGEAQPVKVSVDRGSGFKMSVKLDTKAPSGLTVEPSDTTVKPGEKGDVQFTVRAAADAPLGDQKILVKATPEQGEAVELEFKITVTAK